MHATPVHLPVSQQLRLQSATAQDPTLNGEYGAQFIGGFQGTTDAPPSSSAAAAATLAGGAPVPPSPSPRPLRSSSCAKHYFAYSLENCYTHGDNCRLNFDAVTSQQDIEDTYLPAFQAAVERADVSGLMCSGAPPPPSRCHRTLSASHPHTHTRTHSHTRTHTHTHTHTHSLSLSLSLTQFYR
jgi:hypothetical protein